MQINFSILNSYYNHTLTSTLRVIMGRLFVRRTHTGSRSVRVRVSAQRQLLARRLPIGGRRQRGRQRRVRRWTAIRLRLPVRVVVRRVQPSVPGVRGVGRVHHHRVLPAARGPRPVHGRRPQTVTGHHAVHVRR